MFSVLQSASGLRAETGEFSVLQSASGLGGGTGVLRSIN